MKKLSIVLAAICTVSLGVVAWLNLTSKNFSGLVIDVHDHHCEPLEYTR
ncbi:MAG: hypothetical protein K2W95_33060 [Candidatus Obscuribacterales bacterium]|nr:hypothetical protein [Candidatus Obscuribacterales bacterium]